MLTQDSPGKSKSQRCQEDESWICESHSNHALVLKAKKLCKPWQIEVAVFCFVALSRMTTLQTLLVLYSAVHTLTCSKACDEEVCKAFKLLSDTLRGLITAHMYETVQELLGTENAPPTISEDEEEIM